MDLDEDSDDNEKHATNNTKPQAQQKPIPSKETKKTQPPKEQNKEKLSKPAKENKEKHTVKNVYACDDLDNDEGVEKEVGETEKTTKKDNALSDLLSKKIQDFSYKNKKIQINRSRKET